MKLMISKEEIIQQEKKLLEAIRSSDTEILDQLLHDDLLCLVPGGQVITKQMDLQSHRSGHMTVEKLEAEFKEINIINDTAICIVVYDTKGTMMQQPIEGKFKYLRVWKRSPEQLKVIAASLTPL
jgi:ketosteroid isomerase-like protein